MTPAEIMLNLAIAAKCGRYLGLWAKYIIFSCGDALTARDLRDGDAGLGKPYLVEVVKRHCEGADEAVVDALKRGAEVGDAEAKDLLDGSDFVGLRLSNFTVQ